MFKGVTPTQVALEEVHTTRDLSDTVIYQTPYLRIFLCESSLFHYVQVNKFVLTS